MTTLERTREDIHTSPERERRIRRPWILMVLLAVLGLVVGGVVGDAIRGNDAGTPDILVAGGGEPTARQEQMLAFLDDYEAAFRANDADAVTAMYIPTGRFVGLGNEVRVDDESLASYVESTSFETLDVLRPVLVNGDEMVTFHRFEGRTLIEMLRFTGTGELLLLSHEVIT